MQIARRLGFGLGVLLLSFTGPLSAAAPAAKTPPLCSAITPPCGTNCTNTPFELTKCWTTSYGPARADVVVVPADAKPAAAISSPNMLACQGGGYALCFFSGPPAGIFGGKPLPCTLRRDGLAADCTCQYYSSGTYYVDINGILNQGAYYQAAQQCGPNGCGCPNITGKTCQPNPPSQAAVCTYVNNQSASVSSQPVSAFYPPAQILSTFSFAMSPQGGGSYKLATAPAACHGKYAGCMTAACRFADGNAPSTHHDTDPIQCECPVYEGDYQVGAEGQACTIPSSNGQTYVWSASNTVVVAPAAKK